MVFFTLNLKCVLKSVDILLTLNMTIWIFRFVLTHSAQNDKVRAFVFESKLMPKGTAFCHTEPLAKYP